VSGSTEWKYSSRPKYGRRAGRCLFSGELAGKVVLTGYVAVSLLALVALIFNEHYNG